MKELEKIVDSNGEPLEIVDAEAREDISEIKQSLSKLDGLLIYKDLTPTDDYAEFNDGSNLPLISLISTIEPIQSGSGDPSPDNIRPISGFTEANVSVVGKNLIASSTLVSNTYINQNTGQEVPYNGWTSTDYIPINTNKWYRLLKLVDGSYAVNAGATVYWACYDANLNFVRGSVGDGMKDFPSNAKWLRTSSQTALMNKAVLCEDSDVSSFTTESDYIDGTAYTVEFKDGSNPLIVYGGTLDVVSGVLTVTGKTYVVDENEANMSIQSSRDFGTVFKITSGQVCLNNNTQKSNGLKYHSNAWSIDESRIGTFVMGAEGNIYLQMPISVGGTVNAFKTWLENNNIQIMYPLATPQTYQLTPTQVNSLLGQNYINSDVGDITNVKYLGILNLS